MITRGLRLCLRAARPRLAHFGMIDTVIHRPHDIDSDRHLTSALLMLHDTLLSHQHLLPFPPVSRLADFATPAGSTHLLPMLLHAAFI